MEQQATTILELQPEILNKIFQKLPLKSVIYCKLVIKQWRSFISDPVFISIYNKKSSSVNPLSLIMIPSKPSTKITPARYELDTSATTRHHQPLPRDFAPHDRVAIMGSVNGLVGLYRDPGEFCLFNPSTGTEKTVHLEGLKMNWCADLLFGLCYDSARESYKAVLSISSRGTCRFYIVRFYDGEWKVKTQAGMGHPSYVANVEVGSVVNGVPYWASDDSVFFFDEEKEEFGMAGKPEEWGRRKICGLGCLGGKLSIAIKSGDGSLEIWATEKYEDKNWSWSKLFVVSGGFIRTASLLWRTNGGEGDEIMMDVNGEEVMVYDIESQSLRKVENKMWRTLYNVITYAPSLACPA
ncbi:uncharacterized protein [Phyllobates terribilis]|uniref:uncharacterized protein n=1 Tax=Phyllobates terribilis TaxID=111132 RepID=UPI003CCB3EE0